MLIKARGHGCEISEREQQKRSEAHPQDARIDMMIYPDDQKPQYGRMNDVPSVSFIAESPRKKQWTHLNTIYRNHGGSAGKHNEYDLENIKKETVEAEVVYLLKECFKG